MRFAQSCQNQAKQTEEFARNSTAQGSKHLTAAHAQYEFFTQRGICKKKRKIQRWLRTAQSVIYTYDRYIIDIYNAIIQNGATTGHWPLTTPGGIVEIRFDQILPFVESTWRMIFWHLYWHSLTKNVLFSLETRPMYGREPSCKFVYLLTRKHHRNYHILSEHYVNNGSKQSILVVDKL